MTPQHPYRRPRVVTWASIGLIMAVGAFLRLADLGASAFRADTMEVWRLCHSPHSAATLFSDWLDIVGRTAQFPFAFAFTKGFIEFLGLSPTDTIIRLPSALWGLVAIPFAYLAGAALGRRKFGLFFALLFALSPLHIQISREAYVYAPLQAGCVLLLWSAAWTWHYRRLRQPFPARYFVLSGVGFFLACYSHLSGWWLAALVVPFTLGVLMWRRIKQSRGWREVVALVGVYGVLGAPLLFLPWAVPYFYYDVTHPEVKEQAVRATAHVARRTIVFIAQEAGTAMAWGRTGPRIAFALAVVLAGLVLVAFNRRWRMGRLLAGLLGGSVLLYYAGYVLTATPFAVRHVAFVLPVYLAFLALSVWRLSALPPLRRFCGARLRRAVAWVGAAAGLALFVGPAWASMKLIGKPTPYKKVVQVVDQFLPRGAVVLVDRWFDPWNELKVHPSTNVFFTFTVPNEPLDVFKQVNWRQTAMDFLKKYPDAAYLEIAKSYAEVPEIGPWPWPREFFAHHVIITDEAGLRLRAWGLALRDDFYTPNTNRLVVEFFYNTPEDILARARAEGRDVLVLYGPGWKYTKTNDYRDWRVLEDRAELEIHNLTDKTLAARIRLAAVAVGGTKRVDFGTEVVQTFEAHRLTPWEIGTIVLPPGKQVLRINDRLWSLARIPLLVGEVEIQVAGEAAPVVPAEKPQAE